MTRRLAFAFACLAAPFAAPAAAQEGPIQGVIQGQIDAFLAEDVETAFAYASPMIKGLFGSPARFGMMVQQGYPMVWKPTAVEYVDSARQGGVAFEKVLVRDELGRAHMLMYQMIETGEGWQINGVQLLDELGVGA